jgi:hypothetical protein
MSKDADIFVKDRHLAVAISAAAGWKFRSSPEPRSPVLGAIVRGKSEVEVQDDVLRSVTGLISDDLVTTESITFANAKNYSVPAPDVVLKAKLANVATHEQHVRQEERHVRILVLCCAHYRLDACEALMAGTFRSARWGAPHGYMARRQSTKAADLEKKRTCRTLKRGVKVYTNVPALGLHAEIAKLPWIEATSGGSEAAARMRTNHQPGVIPCAH